MDCCYYANGMVAKYCDEHVCLSVCLSTRISPEPHARSLPHVAYCRGSVLPSRETKSQEEGAVLGIFFPIDNALYCIVFGSHTKTVHTAACTWQK